MKISIFGILFLILFTLKVAGVGSVATLSWWWVTAPLWGGFALVLLVLIVIGGVALAVEASKGGKRGR